MAPFCVSMFVSGGVVDWLSFYHLLCKAVKIVAKLWVHEREKTPTQGW